MQIDATSELTIVIPAYNEAKRLPRTLEALRAMSSEHRIDVIVVDDGSTDGTADAIHDAMVAADGVVIRLEHNVGKGAAVRLGVAHATGRNILVMDADLATDLSCLDRLLDELERVDVAIGSRAVAGSRVIESQRIRRIMGRSFNRLARLLLDLEVADSQCGFKMFRADAAHLLFDLSRVDGFAFDAEILHIASILGLSVREVPVTWTAIPESKVRPVRDSLRTLKELLSIRRDTTPADVWRRARDRGWSTP